MQEAQCFVNERWDYPRIIAGCQEGGLEYLGWPNAGQSKTRGSLECYGGLLCH